MSFAQLGAWLRAIWSEPPDAEMDAARRRLGWRRSWRARRAVSRGVAAADLAGAQYAHAVARRRAEQLGRARQVWMSVILVVVTGANAAVQLSGGNGRLGIAFALLTAFSLCALLTLRRRRTATRRAEQANADAIAARGGRPLHPVVSARPPIVVGLAAVAVSVIAATPVFVGLFMWFEGTTRVSAVFAGATGAAIGGALATFGGAVYRWQKSAPRPPLSKDPADCR